MNYRKAIQRGWTGMLCVLLVLSFVSCDEEHIKDYYIENKCGDEILVRFSIGQKIDSLLIQPGMTELIYSHQYVFGKVGVSDDRYHDIMSNLSVKKDTIDRLLNESRWTYEESGKYHARYTISIDDSIFL